MAVYTTATETEVPLRFEEFVVKWASLIPLKGLWENPWSKFVQFPHYDVEIRRVIDLQHECDREPERPLPASRPGPCTAQLGLAETVALKGPMLPDVSTARTWK